MKKSFIAIALSVSVTAAFSQVEPFEIATGDSKGGSTYSQMYREFAQRCGVQMGLRERETTGSVQNVALLTGNQVKGAFVQTDLLFFTKMTDEGKVANVKTLFALHPEELHFVARADVKKEGGYIGGLIGAKEVSFNTITDVKGRAVGAVGGSVTSARVFSAQSGLNFSVQEFATNDLMKAALLEGKVDTILVVGGAPHKLIESLDGRFRILPVDPATITKVAGVYAPAKLSYSNLGAAGVPSVSTQALFVTRIFRSAETQQQLSDLRACFSKQLPNIQDSAKTHAKWQLVDSANRGKWAVYDLPAGK